MFFLVKITLTTLCITSCQSTLAKQPWPQIVEHEYDQSIYSNARHHESARKVRFPEHFYRNVPHIKPTHPPTIRTEIQYAPLHIHSPDELLSRQYYRPTPTARTTSTSSIIYKQQLEPRILEQHHQSGYQEHQWHLSQARSNQVSSRSPGLNAVYRNMGQLELSETLSKDNNNIARVTRNDDHVKLNDGLQFSGKPYAYKSPSVTMLPISYGKYNVQPGHNSNPKRKLETVRNIYDKSIHVAQHDSLKLKRHQQEFYYNPYNKYHKLHLNIARRHNPNQPTPKSQLHNRLYFQQMYNSNAKKPQPLLNNKEMSSYYYSVADLKGIAYRGEKSRAQFKPVFTKSKY